MTLRPEIFISAGPEFASARKAVKLALGEIGARPVEQSDFSIEHGPLQGILSQMINRCEAVIHLVGTRYGIEPAERTLGAPRRSFSHYEVDVARALGKPILYFISGPDYSFERAPRETEELEELQQRHRRGIERSGEEIQVFTDPADLARRIRALRHRLIVRRRLATLPRQALGDKFVGRRQLLGTLMEGLSPGSITVLHPSEDASALGGTGASTLAIELGWKLYEQRRSDFVFFLPAGPRTDIEANLAALARNDALTLLPDEIGGHRTRLDAVMKWFDDPEHAGRWVVIIDGVDQLPSWLQIRTLLPRFCHGAVILTSRLTHWPGVSAYPLSEFAPETAREFLSDRLYPGKALLTSPERHTLEQLGELLGRVPLSLALAAGHLQETEIPFSEFLSAWKPDSRRPDKPWRNLTLAALIEFSAAELNASTRTLLHLLACLAPEPAAIPLALFDHRGDWSEIRGSLTTLHRRGLIYYDEPTQLITVHRTIREIVRDRLAAKDVTTALGSARASVDAVLHRGESGAAGALLRERLIPHCRALLGQLNGHPLEEHAGYLAQSLAHWMKECGRPSESEPLYRRALAIEEKHRSWDKPNLVLRCRDLASVLRNAGKLAEAEALYHRALSISEAHHGIERPEVVSDLQNLASCLRARNRLSEAAQLLRRASEIEARVAGRHHPRTAIAMNRLAGVLEIQGRFDEAEALYRGALEIDESVAGPKHPRVVVLTHNLAGLLARKGDLDGAEELYRQALLVDQEKFGADHPETTPALKSLAFVLAEKGLRADAETLLRRALAIDEAGYGPSHTEVAMDLANLAGLARADHCLDEAEALLQRAIEILVANRARLRRDHPHLPSALELYAEVLRAKNVGESEITTALRRLVPRAGIRPGKTILPELPPAR